FFTPKRVAEHYLPIMHRVADEQIEKLRKVGEAELSELSFHLAIEVASAVIGLTESRPGLRQRLERFFPDEFGRPGFTSLHGLYWVYRQVSNWLGIYLSDVRPAIRARRRQRRDDVISHLLDEGCTAAEILGECITFAAAGMVTTREFVVAAAWHLFTDEELQARYREAEEPERHAVLQEILGRAGPVRELPLAFRRQGGNPSDAVVRARAEQAPASEHCDRRNRRVPQQAIRDPGGSEEEAAARVVQRGDQRLRIARLRDRRVS